MHLESVEKMLHKHQEIIRFCIVGVLATGIHYGIYLLLNRFILVWLAYTIGYVISFICNFYLTSIFTFKSKATIKKGIGFIFCHLYATSIFSSPSLYGWEWEKIMRRYLSI